MNFGKQCQQTARNSKQKLNNCEHTHNSPTVYINKPLMVTIVLIGSLHMYFNITANKYQFLYLDDLPNEY